MESFKITHIADQRAAVAPESSNHCYNMYFAADLQPLAADLQLLAAKYCLQPEFVKQRS